MKTALITGITGQDGAYLAQHLLQQGYRVVGGKRRGSSRNNWRFVELGIEKDVEFVDLELAESSNIADTVERVRPDELYNLAAQSFVATSFLQPVFTSQVDALSVTVLLETLRRASPHTRFYQASTSEMFGKVQATPQNERTPFYPRSPYGVAKLYAHWMTVNYRESYDLFACCGLLFNHESPLRGLDFVTRKIAAGMAELAEGGREPLALGNLEAHRDWGHARDYVHAMWMMLQQERADDYVIANGTTHSVRDFAEAAAAVAGFDIRWQGAGVDEVGVCRKSDRVLVRINPQFYRPAEVWRLEGDPAKARAELGWRPETAFPDLVAEMVEADRRRLRAGRILQ